MFTEKCLRKIVDEFIGDAEGALFSYKSGPMLVAFVNSYFKKTDTYGRGFPSRWAYLYGHLETLTIKNMQSFFQYIFSRQYLKSTEEVSKGELLEFIEKGITKFNDILDLEGYLLKPINGQLMLIQEDDDLIKIGTGGFAEVYKSKSSGYAIKKLKDSLLYEKGMKHRFAREYEITKELSNIEGVIPIYGFRHDNLSYEMLLCNKTLDDVIDEGNLNENEKDNIIDFILEVIEKVHDRNIIHRDLSLNNVLYHRGNYYITDFGIGKSLDKEYSHRTIDTMGVGQLLYVAPEQINLLADAGKYSDVYSIGKMINAILTGDPRNDEHQYQYIVGKATASTPSARYQNAKEFKVALETFRNRKSDTESLNKIYEQIQSQQYTQEVEVYIQGINSLEFCEKLVSLNGFNNIIFQYLHSNEDAALKILQGLNENKAKVVTKYPHADLFGNIGYKVLSDRDTVYSYETNVEAAELIYWAAWTVNRFNMQDKVEELIDLGIDPTIEAILTQ
ncbi:protein kinase domain-containing protein [Marinilactibacillus psychrotolerans]|uniref:Protein kinase n=1 Tax=Marinilactibacillus psychrotolerans TaxID=191770 RepID=A0ABW8UPK9_9LACT